MIIFRRLVRHNSIMYKAVFIDLDGTLLRSDHSISDASRETIHKLLKRGFLVVPVSARPLHGILPLTNDVTGNAMPVISLNGSFIYHNNEIIHQVVMALQDVIHVYDKLKDEDLSIMYYSQQDWFTTRLSSLVIHEQEITPVKITVQPFATTLGYWQSENTGPNKILVAGDIEQIRATEISLSEQYGKQLNIYQSQPRYLEVMDGKASKTSGIQFLLSRFGILPEEIIAIGDNFNDKGMIEFAGMGIAMGNAPEEIKKAADFVTDTNDNDGVANALNRFFI